MSRLARRRGLIVVTRGIAFARGVCVVCVVRAVRVGLRSVGARIVRSLRALRGIGGRMRARAQRLHERREGRRGRARRVDRDASNEAIEGAAQRSRARRSPRDAAVSVVARGVGVVVASLDGPAARREREPSRGVARGARDADHLARSRARPEPHAEERETDPLDRARGRTPGGAELSRGQRAEREGDEEPAEERADFERRRRGVADVVVARAHRAAARVQKPAARASTFARGRRRRGHVRARRSPSR